MRATDAYEGARARIARFIHAAAPEEIIFTRGTTESINLVAASWGGANLKAGDVILLTEMEHHSNLVPWQLIALRTGAKLRYVPVTGDEGQLDLSALDRLLTPEVKVFAFTHVSNTLGTINPAGLLCARARSMGAISVVDAAQIGRAHAARCAGARLRLPRLLGPQDGRPDRDRRPLWTARAAGRDAALSGRRRNDFECRLVREPVEALARALRGRHAEYRRRRSPWASPATISTSSADPPFRSMPTRSGAWPMRRCARCRGSGSWGPRENAADW